MPNKIFQRVQHSAPRKSAFDLSREQKLSCNFGELIPTYLEEVIPGDQFRVSSETMIRLAPMLSPVMHRVNVHMHYFFVPNRLVWNQWETFITGGPQGESEPVFPTKILDGTVSSSRLADYLGVPPVGSGSQIKISQLPFRAYLKIWNEYYRDATFQDEIDPNTASSTEYLALRFRCWEKDYFTSSLPWTQRGAEIGVPVDVQYKNISEVYTSSGASPEVADNIQANANDQLILDDGSLERTARIENLEESLDFTINELRKSSALQRWLEKSATGGPRYVEQILTHFGVRSSDQRLNRPEYLGGGKQPIVISEVLNTSNTAEHPQGDMTGHGISVGESNSFQKSFEEHGYVMGIMSVLPKSAYYQGIPKHWLRDDKHEFFWPEFANLGEQKVLNMEVYYDPADDEYNAGTFGYQQRYANYKYGRSTVHGDFRTSLDFWHMARKFTSQPVLNEEFLAYPGVDGPHDRVFAVSQSEEDQLWCQLYHNVKARRPIPFFADPSLT